MKKTKTVTTADRRKAFGTVKPGVLFPVPDTLAHMPADYGVFFSEIKAIVARERKRWKGLIAACPPLKRS